MTLTEKASYLKGLAEGMELDNSDKQSKLILAMLDVIDDMSMTISDLEDTCAELSEQLDAVDEDLASVEDDLYDDDDDDCDCCCGDDDDYYEVECPECHDTICLDEDMIDEGSITCPNCGTELEFDFSECDDDCDCCCDSDEEDK
jgi:hypothetical protein